MARGGFKRVLGKAHTPEAIAARRPRGLQVDGLVYRGGVMKVLDDSRKKRHKRR